MEIKKNVLLAPYTSWNIGGPAEFFVQPTRLDELISVVKEAEQNRWAITLMGSGSNMLIADDGLNGLVINMRKFTGVQIKETPERLQISALAGTSKSELLKIFLKYQLAPALFLAGLPGDVAGGVVMNAGISENSVPREFVEIVDWVRVLRDGNIVPLTRDQLQWSYRHCEGWRPGIIVEVGLSWPIKKQPDILEKVKQANAVRLKKQPLDKPSCGSVFVNPVGHKAGQLIEQCGLKGFRIGDAQVSEKHANFIVNLGMATAEQTRAVILHVQNTVKQKTGVQLKTEVVMLGF